MTVGDLIARLREMDPALPVVVSGFDEAGYDHLDTVGLVNVIPSGAGGGGHVGEFDLAGDAPADALGAFLAVHLDF